MANEVQPASARTAAVLTKSDTLIYDDMPDALYIGGTGHVNVVTSKGDTVLFSACPVGMIIPIQIKQLLSSSTTATLVVGLYY